MPDVALQPILALLGHPVAGNPAQYMMEKAFARHQLDCRFLTLEVLPEDLGDAVRGMRALGFSGGTCADPHRHAIAPHLGRLTERATLAGVVNCLFREDNQLVGDNTEGAGMLDAIGCLVEPKGKHVLLLGAGKVARGIAIAFAQAGVASVTIAGRKPMPAAEIVGLVSGKLGVTAQSIEWQDELSVPPDIDILVHATSLSEDEEGRVPLAVNSLCRNLIVADVTLNPPHTQLLRQAEAAGCRTVDGLEMYVRQASLSFQRWTGVQPDLAVMREAVEEFLLL